MPELLNEFSMSRLVTYVQNNRPFVIMSGFRHADEDGNILSKKQNLRRNAQIKDALYKANFTFINVKGAYLEKDKNGKDVEVLEDSLLVLGEPGKADELKRICMNLGKKFHQDSIMYRDDQGQAKLISTRPDGRIGPVGAEEKLGRFVPKLIGQYYTKWRNRPFTFLSLHEEFFAPSRLTFFEYWAVAENRKRFMAENFDNLGEYGEGA